MQGPTIFAIAVLAVCLAAPPRALAHEGHPHKILGTVTMAAADHVIVKTRDGKDLTIAIMPQTKILKDKTPAKISDLAAGTRVVLTVITTKGQSKATEIRIGAKGEAPTGKAPTAAHGH